MSRRVQDDEVVMTQVERALTLPAQDRKSARGAFRIVWKMTQGGTGCKSGAVAGGAQNFSQGKDPIKIGAIEEAIRSAGSASRVRVVARVLLLMSAGSFGIGHDSKAAGRPSWRARAAQLIVKVDYRVVVLKSGVLRAYDI
jgi:hypothetical protein